MLLKLMAASLIFVSSCGSDKKFSSIKEEWNEANDPELMEVQFQKKFSKLPLKGIVAKRPWSDTYWPSAHGGIANRWNGEDDGFKYEPLSKEKVIASSEEDLSKLSPAEKYDIFRGNYDYALVSYERRRTNPDRPGWEGLCHGWAAASINYEEPKQVTLTNSDGVKIPFGSSDVKALLTFCQANCTIQATPQVFLAERCNEDFSKPNADKNSPACRDTNAGSFHIVLASYVGIHKKGFVADMTRDLQVWNHPVYAFESKVIREKDGASPGAAPGTVKEISLESVVKYAIEISAKWEPLGNDSDVGLTKKTFRYRLEINQDGDIVGGDWEQENRPDFLWMQGKAKFTGYFSSLKEIYEASIQRQ